MTFMIITSLNLLSKRDFSDKIWKENKNTHFLFNDFFFLKITPFMWKNMVQYSQAGER
jgi:hypothetical protein